MPVTLKKIANIFLMCFFISVPLRDTMAIFSPISVVLWGGFMVCMVFLLLRTKKIIVPHYQILISLLVCVSLCGWFILGLNNGFKESAISEGLAFFKLIIQTVIVYIAYYNNFLYMDWIKKSLYLSMIIWFFFYSSVIFSILLGHTEYAISFYISWLEARGQDLSQMNMAGGFAGVFPRLGSGRNICPMVIFAFFVFNYKKTKPWLCFGVWLLGLLFAIVDFGRLQIGAFMVISILLFADIIKKGIIKHYYISWILLAIFIFTIDYFSSDLTDFFTSFFHRFGDDGAPFSNAEREWQRIRLVDSITQNVFFGSGLGAYISNAIRAYGTETWQYEYQTLAFVMQFGVIGVFLIVVSYLYMTSRALLHKCTHKAIVIVSLLLWFTAASAQGGAFMYGKILLPSLFLLSRQDVYDT